MGDAVERSFDPKKWQGKMHLGKYTRMKYVKGLRIQHPATEKAGPTIAEVALWWMSHGLLLLKAHRSSSAR